MPGVRAVPARLLHSVQEPLQVQSEGLKGGAALPVPLTLSVAVGQSLKRDAMAAWRRFVSCVQALPENQGRAIVAQ